MALITCPDCKNLISDSAENCIHCGRPMRLSRESILSEIQILLTEQQSIYDLQDYNINNYDPNAGDPQVLWDRLTKVNERLAELRAKL